MHPKPHIYPHCYTPYEVLINMYPRNSCAPAFFQELLQLFLRADHDLPPVIQADAIQWKNTGKLCPKGVVRSLILETLTIACSRRSGPHRKHYCSTQCWISYRIFRCIEISNFDVPFRSFDISKCRTSLSYRKIRPLKNRISLHRIEFRYIKISNFDTSYRKFRYIEISNFPIV